MIKVKWSSYTGKNSSRSKNNLSPFDAMLIEPVPVIKYISQIKDTPYYIKCPAFTDYYKNTYVILSPYDVKIIWDDQYQNYIFNYFSQEVVNNFITIRDKETIDTHAIMTLPPSLLFWSDNSVMIESFPCIFDTETEIGLKTKTIPGVFDIGKWYRPVNFTFEIKKDNLPLIIKRGDPLFCIRFNSLINDKIILEQDVISDHLAEIIQSFTQIKNIKQQLSLNSLYEIVSPAINFYKKMRSKK